jgi:protein-S-isoprenylcysteine O-methyltransferase Ste14
MGASWRADVDPDARTDLVTNGPFRLVRNPVFTATVATFTGLALLVPNLLAVAMLVACVTALQVQVRLVEEPYLHRVHGTAWERYAVRTGRFLPWIGRRREGAG